MVSRGFPLIAHSMGRWCKKRKGRTSYFGPLADCRVVLKYASKAILIPLPADFGDSFNRPSVKSIGRGNNQVGAKKFNREELWKILNALDRKPVPIEGKDQPLVFKRNPQLKALVLLGLNGAGRRGDAHTTVSKGAATVAATPR